MMSEPAYWGSWKGRVIKAIAVEYAQTWSDIQAVTGLSEHSLNTALSELYDAGVLENVDGRYRISYNIYQECRDYFTAESDRRRRINDETHTSIPNTLGIICPYCEERQEVEISKEMPSEAQCTTKSINRPSCSQEWHEGVFRVNVLEIGQHRQRGLGRGQPTIYYIRPLNREQLINFGSLNKSLMMKNGDLIVLTYRRTSKGWFTKKWTGEWETTPHLFQNISINHHWKLKR